MNQIKVNRPWIRHQKYGFQSWLCRVNNRLRWQGLRELNYILDTSVIELPAPLDPHSSSVHGEGS